MLVELLYSVPDKVLIVERDEGNSDIIILVPFSQLQQLEFNVIQLLPEISFRVDPLFVAFQIRPGSHFLPLVHKLVLLLQVVSDGFELLESIVELFNILAIPHSVNRNYGFWLELLNQNLTN